jgi:hypothetical protein
MKFLQLDRFDMQSSSKDTKSSPIAHPADETDFGVDEEKDDAAVRLLPEPFTCRIGLS